ncbi:MAG: P-loop containing nucleoside triphosphate hydrolase protein [Piptocephalis tieghemiana]|nr:MAG: P-loop containing nucleoside triphosphate hydrolase protein [Piptocephalis tieghemiana]
MDLPTTALRLPAKLRLRLLEHQLSTVQQIQEALTPEAPEGQIQEIARVIQEAQSSRQPIQLDHFIQLHPSFKGISSGSASLDSLFKGNCGFPMGGFIEISGPPGCGKTQLCMQVAVNALLGSGNPLDPSTVIYLDTEGDVQMDRLEAMAKPFLPSGASEEKVKWVDRLQYHRIWSLPQLVSIIHTLARTAPSVDAPQDAARPKCILLDGIATPYRSFQGDSRTRTRVLLQCGQILRSLAASSSISVLIMNQMVLRHSEERSLLPALALGDSWSHIPTHRMVLEPVDLSSRDAPRSIIARLIKAPDQPLGQALFTITDTGLSDPRGRKRPHSPP